MKKLLIAALLICGSAQAQNTFDPANFGSARPDVMARNKAFLAEHALATFRKAAFVTSLLDFQCPSTPLSQGGGDPGNVAVTTNANGWILLSGCYLITRDGDVNITWENGRTAYYRRESISVTPYGKRMQK